jgi:nucleotide-binding universal stress UspA family protein
MPSRVVVPLSGSYDGLRAVPHGSDLARRLDATLVLATVPSSLEHDRAPVPGWLGMLRERVEMDRVELLVTEPGDPAEVIVDLLDRSGDAVLCFATHARRGVSEVVHHHVARSMLRHTITPVWVVGRNCSRHPRPGPIVVCHDGSERAGAMVDTICAWHDAIGGPIHLVHLVDPLGMDARPTPAVVTAIERLGRDADLHEVHTAFPVGGLADLAGHLRAQAFAVPLGSLPGHPSGLGHLTADLLRESPCPVLAVRATACTPPRGVGQ